MTIRKSIPIVVYLALLLPSLISCTDTPGALKLSDVIYENEVSHWVGPSGLNRSITIFELPKKTLDNIQTDQTTYLNSLPPTISERLERLLFRTTHTLMESYQSNKNNHFSPTSKPVPSKSMPPFFSDWSQTPIEDASRWHRRNKPKKRPLSVNSFYEKKDFVQLIPRQLKDEINHAINSAGSFYSFSSDREGRIIVISPAWQKAYVLTRS